MTQLLNYNIIPPLLKLYPFIETISVSLINCFIHLTTTFTVDKKFTSV